MEIKLNAQRLKIIAIISMLIDHVGVVLNALHRYEMVGRNMDNFMSDAYWQFRLIGRLAFPIFAFLIAEGCAHTRNIKGYIQRLTLFACLSQLPYLFFIHMAFGQGVWIGNVLITFTFGALAVYFYQQMWNRKDRAITYMAGILVTFMGVISLRGEYDFMGMFIILLMYIFRPKLGLDKDARVIGSRSLQLGVCAFLIISFNQFISSVLPFQTVATTLAILPIALYNGKPGNRKGKFVFYLFYPIHLFLLAGYLYMVMGY